MNEERNKKNPDIKKKNYNEVDNLDKPNEQVRRRAPEKKKHKKVKIAVLSVVCIILVALIAVGVYWVLRFNGMFVDDKPIDGDLNSPNIVDTPNVEQVPGNYDEQSGIPPVVDNDEEIDQSKVQDDHGIIKREPISDRVVNILVMGRDARGNERGRSDSMMLISYNKDTNMANCLSFLRDSLVPIEGHGWTKLGHSYSYGGPGMTINTINACFGLDIQDYFVVDFNGFKNIIDKMGGITVTITEEEAAYYNKHMNWNVSAGEVTLNGEKALQHSRNRSLAGTDFQRTRRQRDVVQAMYRRALEINNFTTLVEIIDYSLGQLQTNMDRLEVISLATEALTNGDKIVVNTTQVPFNGTWKYSTYNSMSVTTFDIEENKKQLFEYIYG